VCAPDDGWRYLWCTDPRTLKMTRISIDYINVHGLKPHKQGHRYSRYKRDIKLSNQGSCSVGNQSISCLLVLQHSQNSVKHLEWKLTNILTQNPLKLQTENLKISIYSYQFLAHIRVYYRFITISESQYEITINWLRRSWVSDDLEI